MVIFLSQFRRKINYLRKSSEKAVVETTLYVVDLIRIDSHDSRVRRQIGPREKILGMKIYSCALFYDVIRAVCR